MLRWITVWIIGIVVGIIDGQDELDVDFIIKIVCTFLGVIVAFCVLLI